LAGGIHKDQPVPNCILKHRIHGIQFAHERFRANRLSACSRPTFAVLGRCVADGNIAKKASQAFDEITVPFSRALGQFMLAEIKPAAGECFEILICLFAYPQRANLVLQLV